MHIGHINLALSMNGTGEHFVKLVEALDRQGARQHVLVRNRALARRVAVYESVTAGPIVNAPVMAYCLMPNVEVAHIHDESCASAGLLLTLTRSIPYILTHRSGTPPANNAISRSMISRAAGLICPTERAAARIMAAEFAVTVDVVADLSHRAANDEMTDNRIAAEHMRIYRRAVDSWRIPALLL